MFGGAYFSGGGYSVADGGTIPVGSATSRYGCGVAGGGNAVRLAGSCPGTWWRVDGTVTLAATAAGTASVSVLAGGAAVGSSSATVAAGATVTVPVCAMVRAGCDGKDLSLALSGASGTVQNVSLVVTRAA